eukprot:CAMPEP_0177603902 /NCGR_PEP_ID=MMETSP0419_2-20121207/15795_1 /TAXON_ID=582737 /ORGANISM="Tetraselmis sp., Strain GSL018" /LENGTH=219 /DNA_ID=CAMNT_0019097775 /DNA_START=209 /DNA_END=868 /DNA_ORIENTATION=+
MAGGARAAGSGQTSSPNNVHNSLASFSAPQYTPGLQLAKYPEVALFSQLGQLFPKSASQSQPSAATPTSSEIQPARTQRNNNSSEGKSSYASRHQAAEQRRRTRINERLERLRKIVPHAERANTAAFLEEVINYITSLQQKLLELEPDARLDLADVPEDSPSRRTSSRDCGSPPTDNRRERTGASLAPRRQAMEEARKRKHDLDREADTGPSTHKRRSR